MTVTTDSEAVRKAFEPNSSPIDRRLDAITQMSEAGLESVITMTPLLPVEDATVFARRLVATGVERFVVQPFHADRGRFVAGTRERAVAIQRELGWSDARYRQTVSVLHESLPSLVEGREGFAP
jgi:DNA repair photolyase